MVQDPNCIFCKIARGEIPSRKAYEDDDVLAELDRRHGRSGLDEKASRARG